MLTPEKRCCSDEVAHSAPDSDSCCNCSSGDCVWQQKHAETRPVLTRLPLPLLQPSLTTAAPELE